MSADRGGEELQENSVSVDLPGALASVLGYRPRSTRPRPVSDETERSLDIATDAIENRRDAAERGEDW